MENLDKYMDKSSSSKLIIIFAVVFLGICILGGAYILSSRPTSTQMVTPANSLTVPSTVGSDTSETPTPTSTPLPQHANQTADQILQGLKKAGMPIGTSFTYGADNDPNTLLGRPDQYTGKVGFNDSRINSIDVGASLAVRDGGQIEVFSNPTDATNRYNYIHGLSTSMPMLSEYEYLEGDAILRISSTLTPTQAQAYEAAFKSLP